MEEKYRNLKLAEKGALLSITAYILLALMKLIIGYITHSKALTADGFNNTTDIISSLAVFIGVRISRKPADEDHLYGHFKAELIASLISSIIMIGVGFNVLYDALHAIVFYKAKTPDPLAAYVAVLSSLLIYLVYRYNKKLAKKINSTGLMAAAKDNLSDAWVSIGAAIGILASQFGLAFIDPLAAVIVGLLIIKTGWDIFREATHHLTDGFNTELISKLTDSIKNVRGVRKIVTLRARNQGNNILVDVIVKINPDLNIIEGHRITEAIERRLKTEYDVTEVIVHVEPDL